MVEETEMTKTDRNGCENDVFVLLLFSRGAESRKKILNTLLYSSKNCSQIAKEVGLDWWTVQRHLRLLLKDRIIESSEFGNYSKYYRLTQKGKEAIKIIFSR